MPAPFDPKSPYDLPALPPQNIILETMPVMKACVEARVALAALNEAVARLPNPDVLHAGRARRRVRTKQRASAHALQGHAADALERTGA